MPQLEVWFQRASDVVRKLSYGDMDLGIVGMDMFAELSHDDPDLVVVHDALDFGHCHLGLGVPMGGKFAEVSTLEQLRSMPEWSESNPLRVVTGYQNVARKFFQEKGFEHVVLLSADGALEAAPLMGSADIILDLVSTGVQLSHHTCSHYHVLPLECSTHILQIVYATCKMMSIATFRAAASSSDYLNSQPGRLCVYRQYQHYSLVPCCRLSLSACRLTRVHLSFCITTAVCPCHANVTCTEVCITC